MGLTVATFNVKDLLEPATDAARAAVPAKLDWLAGRLARCDADVVGLQEVGTARLLEEVLSRLPGRGGYAAPVLGVADARGIACALLSRLPALEARVHTAASLPFPAFREGDPAPFGERIPLRRGVVQATVEAPGLGAVDVFVAHFKSPRAVRALDAAGQEVAPRSARERAEGTLRSLVWRAAEALHVRGLVDAVLAAHPSAHVVAVGDLNDGPGSPVVDALRGWGDGALSDCSASIPAERRFTFLHGARAVQLDHVLCTAGLYGRLSGARILNEDLRAHPPLEGASGHPDDAAPPPTADSDHAPLVVSFG